MFESVQGVIEDLGKQDYICDKRIATVVFLAQQLGKPVLVEGPAGVGKTELAKVVAQSLGRELIRLQCYEGLDAHAAMYEWNYQRQLLAIKLLEHDERGIAQKEQDIFSERYLLRRPLLEAIASFQPDVIATECQRLNPRPCHQGRITVEPVVRRASRSA